MDKKDRLTETFGHRFNKKKSCLKIKFNLLRNEYWDMFSDRYPNKKRVKSHCDTPS
jgi:hypothetical protein